MSSSTQNGDRRAPLRLTLNALGRPDFEKFLPHMKLDKEHLRSIRETIRLALGSPLLSLRQYIRHLFDHGASAATYMFRHLEAATKKGNVVVERLTIPVNLFARLWTSQNLVSRLVFMLAAPKDHMSKELTGEGGILGGVCPTMEEVKNTPLASLRHAYNEAKAAAATEKKTTLLQIQLADLLLPALEELDEEVPDRITFARAFVMSVGPEGTIIWGAGGELGGTSLEE